MPPTSTASRASSGLDVKAPDADGNVAASYDVTNSGDRDGAEVSQVYVTQPDSAGEPPLSLRGFERTELKAGETRTVTTSLDARSFQHWEDGWTTAPGEQTTSVGSSSRDIQLTGEVTPKS
ncbi:fibronectin type III-like domain-contianing protein [Streptomyces sp. NBC_01012]|uniref:fibronectin type III-like domain-contianing protein n=1 Tax=Streptomyces sp. NBC_01012 TaxID=2903717 RepID=UPI003865CD2A|nr:fibronectin type III-like domain-contianing protein [Streptomyces sp. NBC_01012]